MGSHSSLTVVCHIRASAVTQSIQSAIMTLQQYQNDGQLDAVLIRVWPDLVTLSQFTEESAAVRTFEKFTTWAEGHGVDICPPFARETRTSMITGESREVLVTPTLCIATYRNEQLVAVHPHTAADGHHPVAEALTAIQTDQYSTERAMNTVVK